MNDALKQSLQNSSSYPRKSQVSIVQADGVHIFLNKNVIIRTLPLGKVKIISPSGHFVPP